MDTKPAFKLEKQSLLILCIIFIHYWVLALAWPVGPGRDSVSYLTYFFDWANPTPHDPLFMAIRTPLPSFLFGHALQAIGSKWLELGMCLATVGSQFLMYKFFKIFGPKIALIALALVLLQFGYQSEFHVVSSDSPTDIFTLVFLFSLFYGLVIHQNILLTIVSGALVGLLFFSRPTHQLFLVFGLIPLFLPKLKLPKKLALIACFYIGAASFFIGWSYHNYKAFGAFTLARATNVMSPMWRVWVVNRNIKKENGPNSLEFLNSVETQILTQPKYKEKNYTLNDYMSPGDYNEKVPELMEMIDKVWGKSTNYKILQKVALEAILSNPVEYFKGVTVTFVKTFSINYKHPVPLVGGARVYTHKNKVAYVGDDITDHFDDLSAVNINTIKNSEKYADFLSKEKSGAVLAYNLHNSTLPPRNGIIWLGTLFNNMAQFFIPIPIFLLFGFWGFFKNGYKNYSEVALLFCVLFGMAHVFLSCMTIQAHIYQYRFFFEPVYILFGVIGVSKCQKFKTYFSKT